MNYRRQMLTLFSVAIISTAIQTMDIDRDTTKKTHETETRADHTKNDMIQNMIANSYLSSVAGTDFASLDRASILSQLRLTIDAVNVDNPANFDNHIALFNKISAYDKKTKSSVETKSVETKNERSFLSSLWYLLPFVTKPQALNNENKSIQLPIEQHRILSKLLKQNAAIPTTEQMTAFFESRVHNDININATEVTNYTWDDRAITSLPATFCNGLVKFTMSGNTPLDMSPEPNTVILPAIQYWQHDTGITCMSDDTTHTDVHVPGHYQVFDASQSHFIGLDKKTDTIKLFSLPYRTRKYEILTTKENDAIKVKNIIVKENPKHILEEAAFTKKENNVSALIACQHTKEIVYSIARDHYSVVSIQKIKGAATTSPLSIQVGGTIKHIAQLDCSNFICLTENGSLHRITKKFDNANKKTVLQTKKLTCDARFSGIAVDHKTNLCAVTQAGVDHKDALYIIDKDILKKSDTIHEQNLQKIESKNPFEEELSQYEDPHHNEEGKIVTDEKCFSTADTIAPQLQCYNGTVIAWYPYVIIMSGQLSRWGNQSLATAIGKYSAIRTFKTNFQ